MTETTEVSIVMPTFNRWPQLLRALEGLACQTYPPDRLEIVVVSDGSTDGTDERILAGDTPRPVRLIRQQNKGPAAARNAGVGVAEGDLIVFLDDDVVAMPECVATHVAVHAANGPQTVVIGPLLTPPEEDLNPWVMWEQRMLYKQYDAMRRGDYAPTARQFYTGNASLRRELIVGHGGFDESFRRAEDVELAYRLADGGATFVFEPTARAFHHADRSYESWLATAEAYGRNDVIFSRDRGQDWLMHALSKDYRQRNPLTRLFIRAGVQLPWVRRTAFAWAPRWATAMERVGLPGRGRRALSAVYNLAYFQSLSEEIGGMSRFLHPTPAAPSARRTMGRADG